MEFEKQFTKITMKNAVIFLQDFHISANLCCDGDVILLHLRFVRLCRFRIKYCIFDTTVSWFVAKTKCR